MATEPTTRPPSRSGIRDRQSKRTLSVSVKVQLRLFQTDNTRANSVRRTSERDKWRKNLSEALSRVHEVDRRGRIPHRRHIEPKEARCHVCGPQLKAKRLEEAQDESKCLRFALGPRYTVPVIKKSSYPFAGRRKCAGR